ncbi:MAG: P1 family peptidase, partial [Candidatus Kariarchaeaceae archaeon]
KQLGRAAVASARENIFPLGNQGAGISATCGKWLLGWREMMELGGQGAAFFEFGETKILYFVVTNSLGVLKDKKGNVVRGNFDRKKNKRYDNFSYTMDYFNKIKPSKGNTTLSLLVTNEKVESQLMPKIAHQVHSSLARAIDPVHTFDDGDTLFFVTTDEVETENFKYPTTLGVVASELAWDAVLNSFEPERTLKL